MGPGYTTHTRMIPPTGSKRAGFLNHLGHGNLPSSCGVGGIHDQHYLRLWATLTRMTCVTHVCRIEENMTRAS